MEDAPVELANSKVWSSRPALSRILLPAPSRPNTNPRFQLVDVSKPHLDKSPSPFIVDNWLTLLRGYPGQLPLHLKNILQFGASIGYSGPERRIISKNLSSARNDPITIQSKLDEDLRLGRVIPTSSNHPFICSPLGLVPKSDGNFRRIHHLSYPPGTSVNDSISEEASYLTYTTFDDVLALVLQAGRHSVIVKKDVRDAFRNIPLAPHV